LGEHHFHRLTCHQFFLPNIGLFCLPCIEGETTSPASAENASGFKDVSHLSDSHIDSRHYGNTAGALALSQGISLAELIVAQPSKPLKFFLRDGLSI
jgi:hypothetical protein